ncbi:UNKNOWN [Stylonychia lemnae]|uniref:Sperm-tail PG-rich repeat protein n=1 Tax=Stylonychia lemnae TaxID=5949 RepID=A0A078B958_STYLE|nr:UNKNOWN [Stylonychia lemnae]|eukprot:CDW91055.1 UNKNOWN [Stylonychia lemnae]
MNQQASNNYSAQGINDQISQVHSPIYNERQTSGHGDHNSPFIRTQNQKHNHQLYMENNMMGSDTFSNNINYYNQNTSGQQNMGYSSNLNAYSNNANQLATIQHQNQNRRSISNNSTKSIQGPKMSQFITAASSVPAIPGKNQRILINKPRGVSSSKSANRIFNRSQYGRQSNKFYEQGGPFSSFISNTQTANNKSFNATNKRFDTNQEMKELFNKDPGPGSYSLSTAESSVMTGSTASQSTKGVGNGFVSKTERFKETGMHQIIDPLITVGPGSYNPQQIDRHIAAPKIDAKAGFTLPFNEKNPLNYVRPITVNIYFKQQYPGVGTYNPERIQGNIQACQNVFQSQADRSTITKRLNQAANEPAPNSYDHLNGFDLIERDRDAGTKPFKLPIPKKIIQVNIYDPHSAPEDKKYKGAPGPGKYDIPTQFLGEQEVEDKSKAFFKNQGKIYVENNLDRFGRPVMPRKPKDLVPGPGQYEISTPRGGQEDEVLTTKGGYIPIDENKIFPVPISKGLPGPAYYNPSQEPKKISFMFNAAEKWTH